MRILRNGFFGGHLQKRPSETALFYGALSVKHKSQGNMQQLGSEETPKNWRGFIDPSEVNSILFVRAKLVNGFDGSVVHYNVVYN